MDVESRLALQKQRYFREPQATQSVAGDVISCRSGVIERLGGREDGLADDGEEYAGGDCRTNDAGHVRTHRVH